MGEGLSPIEVGKEVAHHSKRGSGQEDERRDRLVTIAGAVLLSVGTLLAAWSGYSAAKFQRVPGGPRRRDGAAREGEPCRQRRSGPPKLRLVDVRGVVRRLHRRQSNRNGDRRAPLPLEFRVAFDAWRATSPETNSDAPPGPTYVPEYKQPGLTVRRALDERADDAFGEGEESGATADKYVRLTVVLASILFLVGISTQFALRGVRDRLIALATVLLLLSLAQVAALPKPPL